MTEQGFYFSLSQAAKETRKSKSVLSGKIKSGQLSASKNEKGNYQIDPSELFRVFPKNEQNAVQNVKKEQNRTPEKNGENTFRIKELELELKFMNKEKSALEKEVGKIEQERDDWKHQAQKLLLTHDKPTEPTQAITSSKKDSPVLWAILGGAVFILLFVAFVIFYPEISRLLNK